MIMIDLRKHETLGRLFLRFGASPPALHKRNVSPQDVTELLLGLDWLLSLLIKAESIARLQLAADEPGSPLLNADPGCQIQFIKQYLENYSSSLFSFNRSERQTFVFVLENVMEYLRQQTDSAQTAAPPSSAPQFIDSRFWFENLFKMVDEKLTFNLGSDAQGRPVLLDSDREIPLTPFVIKQDETILLFSELDQNGPVYRSLSGNVSQNGGFNERLQLAEYLIQNLALTELEPLLTGLSPDDSPLLSVRSRVQAAVDFYREGDWQQTITTIDRIAETLETPFPLLQRLRILSLLRLRHSAEAINEAKLFLSRFPTYSSLYEVIAEAYEQKEDYSSALSAYERAAQFSRSRNLAAKIKELKQRLKDKKEEQSEDLAEYLAPVSISEEQHKTMVKRPALLQQMAEVLGSEHRPNLLLVGDGGVGKTSLIQQFVSQLEDNPGWKARFNFRDIRTIQFVHLLTGSKYRGQFEEKVLALLNEAVRQKVLLMIEDIHLLFSQGGARGTALDFINIVRPFLQEKKLQMVATTHYEELKNTLERDNAFMGCFHQILVRACDETDTLEIINRVRAFRREQWGIHFPRELLPEVMELSRQLLRSRAFPDAPLLLLDRVYAKIRRQFDSGQDSLDMSTFQRLLAETVKDMANLPDQLFGVSIHDRLARLEERIAARIIGQDRVLSRLSARITAYKRGFKIRSNRPDGVFLLVGPTGVGKTETAHVLAEELIGSRDALLRVDMSEYMEKYTYSRFIGAAPGYVGYNDTNQLTDKVRQNPMTIILLDEIEKADPQLLNIFLQVFDAGRLTDARGRVVDFSATVILMTSNVGTELYSASTLGYQEQGRNSRVAESSLVKMIKKRFSPEFLNRIDDILVFSPLADDTAMQIVSLQLETIKKQLLREGKLMMIAPAVIEYLARQGVSAQYGARQLSRVITRTLLEPLAGKAITEEWQQGNLIYCELAGETVQIRIQNDIPEPRNAVLHDSVETEQEMECDS